MSQPIASCYLNEPEDEANYLYLTSTYLKVLRRGKERKYGLSPFLKLEINHRTLLAPLIGGGLLSSISLTTLFTFSKWPILLLILSIAGLLLIYYGVNGVSVLTLKEDKIHYDINLPKVSEALPSFLRFTNRLIPGLTGVAPLTFPVWYVPAAYPSENYLGDLYLELPSPAHLADRPKPKRVDLVKLPFEITFEFDEVNQYRGKIKHPIPEDAFSE